MPPLQVERSASKQQSGLREIPQDVASFAARHNVSDYLSRAIGLAHATFPSVREIRTEIETDPDVGGDWIVILVDVHASVEDVVKADWAYTRQWIELAPPEAREKIVLLYNVID